MSKPVIFTVSTVWDDEASVWTGHCDDIPAAADAPTLDELLGKILLAMAIDLLPDNHPGVDPTSVFVQITALREAKPTVARWRHNLIGRCGTCCAPRAARWSARARAATRFGTARSRGEILPSPLEFQAGTRRTQFCDRLDCQRPFDAGIRTTVRRLLTGL